MLDTISQIPDGRTTGVARAAEAMIRALGGSTITLLFPMLTANGQQIPGLGLEPVATEQIEIAPAAMLTLTNNSSVAATRMEIIIPGSAVFSTMAERLAATPENLFDSALGVIHEGRLLRIESWSADHLAEIPYVFRVIVQG